MDHSFPVSLTEKLIFFSLRLKLFCWTVHIKLYKKALKRRDDYFGLLICKLLYFFPAHIRTNKER
jgi:hypothetical protein